MKIAILTPTYSHFSGIDRLVEINTAEYVRQGHKVMIMCLKATMKSDKAKVVQLGMPKSPFFERMYRLLFFLHTAKIDKAVRMLKGYDLVVSHFYPMNIIAKRAKKLLKIRYQYYNAGVSWPRLFKNPLERLYMQVFTWLSNSTAKGCDEAISISNFMREELLRETGIDSEVKYIPVDKKFNAKVSGKVVRDKYKLGKDPVLLYLGRISPHKGVHLLIEAYKLAKQKIPGLKLMITGKHTFPAYSRKLKRMADEGVIFTGFVADEKLPGLYGACSLYTTASLWEGYDIPVVEAQACGKKVVAFDAGSHKEVVKKGLLVKSGDVEGFSKAIVRLLHKI
ncbi:MAG: glycosyltransferase family 4 protein [Nanoarchaeota archaeon]|nr:glycosyltransferase family 4 protein [Nanoarchaeota archaeon]